MNYYFVYDYYSAAGRPKAEDAVMAYASKKYLYCLIEDRMLEDVQMDLERYCMKIREENKRLAPVNISVSDPRHEFDGHRVIHIGQQSMRLRKVRETINVYGTSEV